MGKPGRSGARRLVFDLLKMIAWRVDSEEMANPEPVSLGLCGDKALREQSCDRDANDDFDAPAFGHIWAEAADDEEMVVADGEAADGDAEMPEEELKPSSNHAFVKFESLAETRGSSHVA
jgi:hypothetical protein